MTKPDSGSAEDIIALRNIVVLYCRGVDRRDISLLRTLFHSDATMDYGVEHYLGDIEPWYAAVGPALAGFDITQHHITNSYFEVNGDRAEGESYLMSYHVVRDQPNKVYMAGARYLDKFERRNGVWKIIKRTALRDWENEPGHVGQPNLGTLDRHDLSYTAVEMFGKR
jgi:hypothetical protein